MTKQSKKSEKNYSPTVLHLTRKQILQMAEIVNHFEDVNNYELHVSHSSGIGPGMNLRFVLDLTGGKTPVNVDTTDIETW